MVNHFDYYTGIIFSGYTYGTGDAIGKGGRYDNLLNQFGKNAPACGFTILTDDLLSALSRQNIHISLKSYDYSVLVSPDGDQEDAIRLSKMENIIIVCGHYEGIDQRFIDECVDEEISLGDFVLTGGEIAAMAVTDAVCRMVPGVLADPECFEDESHFNGLLEYPQYSRPAVWHGREVPAILLSGNHEKVRQWRRKQALRRTKARRPDMYEKLDLSSKQDQKLLKEMQKEDMALEQSGDSEAMDPRK
jgi:tRNA (guanine-N1)-methyltransferase